MNAYSFFTSRLDRHPESVFIADENGAQFTYAAVHRESARIANFLSARGLKRGDRVAAQIEKSPQALLLYFACLRAGLCYLPLNPAYQRDELAYFIEDATPGLVVCAPERAGLFSSLSGAQLFKLDMQGQGSLRDAYASCADHFNDAAMKPEETAVIIYTSGTTGRSKGAMVTHGNLTSNAQSLKELWCIEANDVLLHALPLFHIHGLFVAIHPLMLAGAKILFQPKFDGPAILRGLADATLLMGVPTFYTRLLQEPGLNKGAVAHMRLFVSGSAPLLRDTFEAWRRRTGHTILERYGMSEAGMIASNPYQGERRSGTVGFPLPGVEIRIVADAIEVKGPNVFSGYWRMPEKTREEFSPGGWFKTGDMGHWDEEGYLSIAGRAKDLIISGGFNVYPKEVELVLDALSGVAESAVIGVPHADFGEAVMAVVVAQTKMDEAMLIAQLKQQIAAYKVPKRIHFVAELPRNTMGKVQKNLLRERFGKAG